MKLHRPLMLTVALTLLFVAACGDDSAVVTTAGTGTTTTAGGGTTTIPVTGTTVPKPEDTRISGLALAGGFVSGSTPVTVPPETPTTTDYSEYVPVVDDSGYLTVNVPAEWSDQYTGPWVDNIFGIDPGTDGVGVAISASPDIDSWTNTWGTPGLFFGASTLLGDATIDDLLNAYSYLADQCTYDARYAYDDGVYAGSYDWWDNCGGVGTVYVVIVARPAGGEFTSIVEITMVTEADLAAADEIVGSYYVTFQTGDTGAGAALDASLDPNYGAGELTAGFQPDPQAIDATAGGDIDVSAYLGGDCAGYVTTQPDLEITWSGSTGTLLRFFFVATTAGDDTVLVINDPNGDWFCADDSYGVYDPTIDFATGPDGVYDIWIGTYSADTFVPGTFFVTELDANHPG